MMGLLHHRQHHPRNNPECTRFLESADDAYILAYRSRNIKPFLPYATSDVCSKVLNAINAAGNARNFGANKLRTRKWLVQKQDDGSLSVIKEITHKKVNIGDGIEIALAEDIKELWVLSIVQDSKGYRIVKLEVMQ